jgi:capsid protein
MTYEEFTGDLSGVNFSSICAGLNQSQRKYKKEQHRLIHMVCLPIWRRFFETAFLNGKFNFENYLDRKRDYDRVQFQAPGWAYVNPLQEVRLKKSRLGQG